MAHGCKSKNAIKKKRLMNQLYIKLGIINAGNDNPNLKNQVKKISNQINKLSLH